MKSIYILLVRTNTVFSKLIHMATKGKYTHVALSLDRELTQLYSFGRKLAFCPIFAGFKKEHLHRGTYFYNQQAPCAVYELQISDEAYFRIICRLLDMLGNQKDYHYNYLGVVFHLLDIPYRKEYHFLCSQFVADTLFRSEEILLPKEPLNMMPMDFCHIVNSKVVYQGILKNAVYRDKFEPACTVYV